MSIVTGGIGKNTNINGDLIVTGGYGVGSPAYLHIVSNIWRMRMKPIRQGEVQLMTREQDDSYADWFLIGILTEIAGIDGGITKSYVDGAPKQGSIISPTSTQAYTLGQIDTGRYDALLRCNSAISLAVGDRISVFSRNDTFTNEIFYVNGPPVYFRTDMVVPLTLVIP
jgi:hypothetical protein